MGCSDYSGDFMLFSSIAILLTIIYFYSIMNKNSKLLICAIVIGVLINLILPTVLARFATKEQIKPPKGAAALPFFDQLMHMFVHHAQVPLTSSIIVAIIVGLSVFISNCIC